jgi:hypothetical protein
MLTGWLVARIIIWVMSLFSQHELAQISISIALPYLAYIGAEQSIGASGVIAVVTAGMTLNLTAPGRLPPQAWENLREVCEVQYYLLQIVEHLQVYFSIPDTNHDKVNKTDKKESVEQAGRCFVHHLSSCIRYNYFFLCTLHRLLLIYRHQTSTAFGLLPTTQRDSAATYIFTIHNLSFIFKCLV